MLGYSWLIYALTVVIFTGFYSFTKRGSQFLKRYFCLFYIAYGFVYQLHGANDFKCFFNRFIKNKLLWIASNVLLLLINIWIALKIPIVFLRLNRVLENSRIFWLFTLLLILLLLFVF